MVYPTTLFLLFMYFSVLKTDLSFLEKTYISSKIWGLQKKTDCISKLFWSFYFFYLLTTPGSFKINLRTPSLYHILKYDVFFRSKIELQNIEERSFHIGGGSAQDGGGGGGDILPQQDPNCACWWLILPFRYRGMR